MNGFARARINAGLTQAEAAERIGNTQATISLWEKGGSFPRGKMVPRIAEVYGCTISALYEDADQTPRRRVLRRYTQAGDAINGSANAIHQNE